MALVLPTLLLAGLGGLAQQVGTAVPEQHPRLPTLFCTLADGCRPVQTSVVADALSRPLHVVGQPQVACSAANRTQCPDAATCARGCALDGVDYAAAGVSTAGATLTLQLLGRDRRTLSPRVYLLEEEDAGKEEAKAASHAGRRYQLLRLANQELAFDVDVSRLGCGINGALYLVEMDATGGQSASLNPAGARYGTGYCDAQCPDTPFASWFGGLDGLDGLNRSAGACCNELDVWEANRDATALTSHVCGHNGPFLCFDDQCGRNSSLAGPCDKDGCSINPFRTGKHSFYRPGGSVDTRRPFTVVTQFVSANNTTVGSLVEIRRLYIQDGRLVTTSLSAQSGSTASNTTSITTSTTATAEILTDDICTDNGSRLSERRGGLRAMGHALARGMVAVFSLWDAPNDFMAWLDSGSAGPCSSSAGDPARIAVNDSDASVSFSNIRWGDIGATVQIAPNGSVLQIRMAPLPSSSSSSSLSSLPSSPSSSPSSLPPPHSPPLSLSSSASVLVSTTLPMSMTAVTLALILGYLQT